LFDCAGLVTSIENILDELTQQAAFEALRNSSVVIFCVDASKDNWSEDISVYRLIKKDAHRRRFDQVQTGEAGFDQIQPFGLVALLHVATKTDLLSEEQLPRCLVRLGELFGVEFLPISVKEGSGLKKLRKAIDRKIIESALGQIGDTARKARYEMQDTRYEIALTTRHRQAVTEAIESINQATDELKSGNEEVVAMMLRAAYRAISEIQSTAGGHVDEQILRTIFSRFCIGK
jgi:tRNA U34 5-carboxymethylaminomethyl modifying GTPase MnmE/TrmE